MCPLAYGNAAVTRILRRLLPIESDFSEGVDTSKKA
jgi:hypothetical protein